MSWFQHLAPLLFGVAGVPPSTPAEAAADVTPPAAAYETSVTALRFPRPLPDVPASVTVMPRAEIERTPALAPDDLLRALPGAATFRRTPSLTADPTAQGLNLRGVGPSGVSRALVLLDGVPVNDPFGGWITWRALPLLGLERIEVVPGGGSALYGNYALGGVVELKSKALLPAAEADAAVGSLGTLSGAGRVAGTFGRVAAGLELSGLRSDGYVPVVTAQRGAIDQAAASHHGTANARVAVTAGPATTVSATAGLFDEHENGGTRWTTARVRTLNAAVALVHAPLGSRTTVSATAFGQVGDFDQQRARIAAGRSSEALAAQQHVPSDAQGVGVLATSTQGADRAHHLGVAIDARRVHGRAEEVLLPATTTPATVVARRTGGEQLMAGASLFDTWSVTRWLDLAPAIRFDVWRNDDGRRVEDNAAGERTLTRFAARDAAALSPRLAALLRLNERTRLRASVYRAFRAPTLNELYRPFQVGTIVTLANDALAPEHLTGAEVGVERLFAGASAARLTAFANRLEDPIVNVTVTDGGATGPPTRQRLNLGRARIVGIESAIDARLSPAWALLLAYTLADNRVTSAPGHPELVSRRLPQDPVHRAHGALSFASRRGFVAAVHLRVQSAQFDDDANQLRMGPATFIDAFASVPLSAGWSVYASAQNLLDNRVLAGRSGVDTLGPPLIAMVGVRLR